MRKGIMSLLSLGRGKTQARRKTANMKLAEQASAKKTEPAGEESAETNDKMFVQTIKVPKPRQMPVRKGAGAGKGRRRVKPKK